MGLTDEEKMAHMTTELCAQMTQSSKLDKLSWANLEDLGFTNGGTR